MICIDEVEKMNRIRKLRVDKGITQEELGKILNVQKAAVSKYELGKVTPSPDVLKKLSEYFNVSTDYLLCIDDTSTNSNTLPVLTPKDEREIARDLENMIESLKGSAAMGDVEDEEDKELLRASLETAMKLSKRIAKKKFTPKKYKKE
jgi:transcriptional regulator with XRE-family HTH domain